MDGLFGLIGLLLGIIITQGINWIRDRQEREEKYKLSLYAKRLGVHQEAFTHIRKLRLVSHSILPTPEAGDLIDNARNWWATNCLYLDDTSREGFDLAISRAYEYLGILEDSVNGEDRPRVRQKFAAQLDSTQQAIFLGIGKKHLDVWHDAKQVASENN